MKNRNSNLPSKRPSRPAGTAQVSNIPPSFPFAAIVGQAEMKLGLVLNVIDPSIGGVLIMGHRGTAKSTAVRGLADLLPDILAIKGCPYRCDPADINSACDDCRRRLNGKTKPKSGPSRVSVVDLPLGATEDRICGSIDIQTALSKGMKAFEPGLLARANRNFLYIDEVNLLEDHLVDLLLDVAVTGQNQVERENISVKHPARFVLIGSGNPEEGELRPQLLDRFGLSVDVTTAATLDERVEIVEKREAYDRNPREFCQAFTAEQEGLRQQIVAAKNHVRFVRIDRSLLHRIAALCDDLKVDGHRGELTITRAARSLAAFEGKDDVSVAEIRRVAPMALRHRLRRDPLEETAESDRVQRSLERVFGEPRGTRNQPGGDDGEGSAGRSSRPVEPSNGRKTKRRERVEASSPTGVGGESEKISTAPMLDSQIRLAMLPNTTATEKRLATRNNRSVGNKVRNGLRGRYVRATAAKANRARVALDATLRAILSRPTSGPLSRQVSRDEVRYKELSCKAGRLHIFAIDTSGSMALHRIRQAKGAMLDLLKRSYMQRDYVAIVGFGGFAGEIFLPPSRSILRARRVLDSLRVGGGTPLTSGLLRALELSQRVGSQLGEVSVLLFTDGNANVPWNSLTALDRSQRQQIIDHELQTLRGRFAKQNVSITVVDTQNSYMGSKDAQNIAKQLGARYQSIKASIARGFGNKPPNLNS